jgi:DNA primase
MALPPGFLDELRSRTSLSGLVGRKVKLVRRDRKYAGLCPFHHEETPSFYVVEDKFFLRPRLRPRSTAARSVAPSAPK